MLITWQNVPEDLAYIILFLILKLKNNEYFFKNLNKTVLPGFILYQNLFGKFDVLRI
jgi:hypothetical protein